MEKKKTKDREKARRRMFTLPRACPLTGDISRPIRTGRRERSRAGKGPWILERKICIYDPYKECTKKREGEGWKRAGPREVKVAPVTEFIRVRDPFVLIKLADERGARAAACASPIVAGRDTRAR